MMNVLVIGGGGREHALCWTIGRSSLCGRLYCMPGNGGIQRHATCLPQQDVLDVVKEKRIDFVVIGPEQPLVEGLVDRLTAKGILSFGHTASAARLEGSKRFMKELCERYRIPTAKFRCFDDRDEARAYVREEGVPIVIKADGLASGKGVTVARTLEEADVAIHQAMYDKRFGRAGEVVVIEEYLEGEEVSFFALVDGEDVLALTSAQDHKAAYDGDLGPNTGGMGAYSPTPFLSSVQEQQVMARIIRPTVQAMVRENCALRGVLYAGLMVCGGEVYVLEFNVRFGDPECQVLLLRLRSDLLPALLATSGGTLDVFDLRWSSQSSLGVVLASQGYPGDVVRGSVIRGLEHVEDEEDVCIFHAATRRTEQGWVADGGRVLTVTALGDTLLQAQQRAYSVVSQIDWPGGFYRRDIGWRALRRS